VTEVTTKLRVVIADDERPARAVVGKLLRSFADVELVGEAENGLATIELIEHTDPDLALIDLQMPGLDGLGVARKFKAVDRPVIVFVTAYDEYAVSAFQVQALDYLLKPVDRKRLADTLARTRERLEQLALADGPIQGASPSEPDSLTNGMGPRFLDRIPVRQKEDIILLPVSQIASIVANGELLHLTTTRKERYVINHRLKSLEHRLDPHRFIRLDRGSIVSVESISRVTPMPGGAFLVTLANTQQLKVSRAQSRVLRKQLLRL
jgi:two-component system, LytTR family, response regulator